MFSFVGSLLRFPGEVVLGLLILIVLLEMCVAHGESTEVERFGLGWTVYSQSDQFSPEKNYIARTILMDVEDVSGHSEKIEVGVALTYFCGYEPEYDKKVQYYGLLFDRPFLSHSIPNRMRVKWTYDKYVRVDGRFEKVGEVREAEYEEVGVRVVSDRFLAILPSDTSVDDELSSLSRLSEFKTVHFELQGRGGFVGKASFSLEEVNGSEGNYASRAVGHARNLCGHYPPK